MGTHKSLLVKPLFQKTSAFDPTEDQMCNSFIAAALMRKKQLFHLWRAHVWTAMDTAA